jgi:hypothetical protein
LASARRLLDEALGRQWTTLNSSLSAKGELNLREFSIVARNSKKAVLYSI